jgi:hypothetical protein
MKLKTPRVLGAIVAAGALSALAQSANAGILITEVDPFGSANGSGYGADWFELTNTGTTAVTLSTLTMTDDHADSNASAASGTDPAAYYAAGTISTSNLGGTFAPASLTLANGQTTLGAGQTAVFLESSSVATASASSTIISNFKTAWGSNLPSNALIGVYDDSLGSKSSEYGLSQTNDMVNIFQGGSLLASVALGADGSGTPLGTFDNTAGLNKAVLGTFSVAGVNGAFDSASGAEIGSPGVAPVPLPGTLGMLLSGVGALIGFVRRPRPLAHTLS